MGASTVIPCHYDTFPPIETDAQAFKSDVESRTGGKTTVEVLEPGGTLTRLGLAAGAAPEPHRVVLAVVRHQHGAEEGEERAGGAVVNPLSRDPDAAARQVEPDQAITVCPWPP